MAQGPAKGGTVYFEFTRVGQQMRVAAIDGASGAEVVIVAPLTVSQARMQEVALAKLKRKLAEAAATGTR